MPVPYPLCESKFTRVSNAIKPPRTSLKGQGYLPAIDMWKLLEICGFEDCIRNEIDIYPEFCDGEYQAQIYILPIAASIHPFGI